MKSAFQSLSITSVSGLFAIFGECGDAHAGAWGQEPSRTEVIATYSAKEYAGRFENEADIYAERGLKAGWTLVTGVRGWARGGINHTFAQVGVRRQYKVAALEAAAVETRLISGRDWNDCGGWGLETRALAGRNLRILGRPIFADAAVAARGFSDGCNQVRTELTVGSVPQRGFGTLVQANVEYVVPDGAFTKKPLRSQVQASILYGLSHSIKLQVAARAGYENQEQRENALIVGVWHRF